jgi:predicted nucleic acid-binding protein
VSQAAAFWDASALVPLCVDEVTSRQAQSHLRAFMPVVWWGSLVEVHSAIARLNRQGQLNDVGKKGALSRLNALCQGWREILPDDNLRDLSTRLLDIHDLRAADCLQLGAALTWCRQRPAKRNFVCGDQRLSKAAVAAGFSIIELSRRVS